MKSRNTKTSHTGMIISASEILQMKNGDWLFGVQKTNYNHIKKKILFLKSGVLSLLLFNSLIAYGQEDIRGNVGIEAATNQVSSFFENGVSLMYAIGAIVGLVGAIKVFNKWNSGDPDTGKVAAAWFGSCVFLVVVALVLRSFFG